MNRRTLLMIAAATSVAPRAILADEEPLRLRDLYTRYGSLSERALSLVGQRIVVSGYMAPPLKAEASFFVLTRYPLAVCPFCDSAEEWPPGIAAVYTKRAVEVVPYTREIAVRGVLEHGEKRDEETGFVSMLRLADATYG